MPQVCRRDYTFLKTAGRMLPEGKIMIYLYYRKNGNVSKYESAHGKCQQKVPGTEPGQGKRNV